MGLITKLKVKIMGLIILIGLNEIVIVVIITIKGEGVGIGGGNVIFATFCFTITVNEGSLCLFQKKLHVPVEMSFSRISFSLSVRAAPSASCPARRR